MSAPVGMKQSPAAATSGIRSAKMFVARSFPRSLSVTENIPPSARPTNSDTVGRGAQVSASSSGFISDSTPSTSPMPIGKSVLKLRLKSVKSPVTALISRSYIPTMAAIDPPEKPGMINATPMRYPAKISVRKPLFPIPCRVLFSFILFS